MALRLLHRELGTEPSEEDTASLQDVKRIGREGIKASRHDMLCFFAWENNEQTVPIEMLHTHSDSSVMMSDI